MSDDTVRAMLDLPLDSAAPAQARRLLGDLLAAWRIGGDVQADALLVLSELVTNAVVHGGGEVSVEVESDPERLRLRLAVSDGNSVAPRPRGSGPLDGNGRGLQLVEALSSRWGVDSRPAGKRVWAELDLE